MARLNTIPLGGGLVAIGAYGASLGVLALFHACGYTALGFGDGVLPLLGVSIACAAVELLPFGDDNWTVPLVAALLTAAWTGAA